MAASTLAEVGAREQLLEIRKNLPTLDGIVEIADRIDLRSIKDDAQRSQVRDIRALGKELRNVLRTIK